MTIPLLPVVALTTWRWRKPVGWALVTLPGWGTLLAVTLIWGPLGAAKSLALAFGVGLGLLGLLVAVVAGYAMIAYEDGD